jgi:hypothetical protein
MRLRISLLTLIFLSLSLNVNSGDWNTFKHPSGVFTVNIPKEWGEGIPFQYDPNIFTFKPSESSELTISITQNLNLPSELPMRVVSLMFPDEKPLSEPKREKGDSWNSIRQDFEKTIDGKTRIWLGQFYGFHMNAIAITLSDSKENIEQHKITFKKIVSSIKFNK